MKILLVIVVTGLNGTPVFVPVGILPSEAACENAGRQIVAGTIAASAPASADFLCLSEAAA